jgi:hypothetical protein
MMQFSMSNGYKTIYPSNGIEDDVTAKKSTITPNKCNLALLQFHLASRGVSHIALLTTKASGIVVLVKHRLSDAEAHTARLFAFFATCAL